MSPQTVFTPERKHYLATRLAAGACTQAERDEAMAMMVWCLWDDEKLRGFITQIQNEKCRQCQKGNLLAVLQKNWILILALAFLTLALVIANLTGTDVSPVFTK